MRPPIDIREKYDSSVRCPVKVCLAVSLRIRSPQRFRRFPEPLPRSCIYIGSPDRPRNISLLEDRVRRAASSRCTHECNSLSISRPPRGHIARARWCEPHYGRGVAGENPDPGVIAAIGNECEARSVGRPGEITKVATYGKELFRRSSPVDRADPDLVIVRKGNTISPRGNSRLVALSQRFR